MKEADKYKVGELELGDKVYISDPIYSPYYIWWPPLIEDIKPGKYIGYIYKSYIEGYGRCVIDILITHKDYPDSYPTEKLEDVEVDVNSGRVGIFDIELYENIRYNPIKKNEFYEKVGDLIYSYDVYGNKIIERSLKRVSQNKEPQEPMDAAVISGKCILSDNRFGNGDYDLYYSDNEIGEIVALRLNFIREES